MDVRRRRHHRASALRLDDRGRRGTVRQAGGTAGKKASRRIDFDPMERFGRHVHRVDIKFAADDMTHAAFGTHFVVDF